MDNHTIPVNYGEFNHISERIGKIEDRGVNLYNHTLPANYGEFNNISERIGGIEDLLMRKLQNEEDYKKSEINNKHAQLNLLLNPTSERIFLS